MDYRDFEALQVRAVAWTPRVHQLEVAHIAGELLRRLPQLSGDPVILPLPSDAPAEIPRIILKDSAESMQMQIGVNRSDIFLQRQSGMRIDIDHFVGSATEALDVLLDSLGVRPGRLASTADLFYPCDDPASVLATHFCRPEWTNESGPLNDLRTFELHAHRRLELMEGLQVNSWVRCKVGSVSEAGASRQAIIVERDINTLPEEAASRTFDGDEVTTFIRVASSQLVPELAGFFPLSS